MDRVRNLLEQIQSRLEDLNKAESRQLRQRSARLLGSLLRPLRGKVAWTFVIVVISTAAQVTGHRDE